MQRQMISHMGQGMEDELEWKNQKLKTLWYQLTSEIKFFTQTNLNLNNKNIHIN